MDVYYLDYRPDPEETVDIELGVGEGIDLHRIPWLLPVRDDQRGLEAETVRPHLIRAGVAESRGRVGLVAPQNRYWYASFAEAIHSITGHYPFLIQTAWQREALSVPGPLRIVDLEAYIMEDDARALPPWLEDGGLIPDL